MSTTIPFVVHDLSYFPDADAIQALVQRHDETGEPIEAYQIELEFARRRHKIEDLDTTFDSSLADLRYPAQILFAFMNAWHDAYMALGHDASPADVRLETFNVETD